MTCYTWRLKSDFYIDLYIYFSSFFPIPFIFSHMQDFYKGFFSFTKIVLDFIIEELLSTHVEGFSVVRTIHSVSRNVCEFWSKGVTLILAYL